MPCCRCNGTNARCRSCECVKKGRIVLVVTRENEVTAGIHRLPPLRSLSRKNIGPPPQLPSLRLKHLPNSQASKDRISSRARSKKPRGGGTGTAGPTAAGPIWRNERSRKLRFVNFGFHSVVRSIENVWRFYKLDYYLIE